MSAPQKLEAHYQVPYHEFLDQDHIWPRVPNDKARWDQVTDRDCAIIHDMPPQYAAASLNKLVRWAVYAPAGPLLAVADVTAREEAVRVSVLGRALAARAQGLQPGEDLAVTAGNPANTNHLVATVMVELYNRTPLEPAEAIDVSAQVVGALLDRWQILEKP